MTPPPMNAQTFAAAIFALVCIVLGFIFFACTHLLEANTSDKLWRINLRMAMLRVSVKHGPCGQVVCWPHRSTVR